MNLARLIYLAIALAIVFTGCCGSKAFPIHTAKRTSVVEEVPSEVLAWHLKGLGRDTTIEEVAVIKHALFLMRQHQIGIESTLQSIDYRYKEKMWNLFFVSPKDDGNFIVFLRDDKTNIFSMQPIRIASRSIRFELKDE